MGGHEVWLAIEPREVPGLADFHDRPAGECALILRGAIDGLGEDTAHRRLVARLTFLAEEFEREPDATVRVRPARPTT